MTIQTKLWLILCAIIAWTVAAWYHGYHTRDLSAISEAQALELKRTQDANQAWAERFTLQAQLATRDQQLAASQAEEAQKRTEIVIKREVIYRDKIKNPATAKCVADSGLLELIDAANGIDSTKR